MKLRKITMVAALVGGLWWGGALANVPFWGDKASQSVETPASGLKQGQWVWSPAQAPLGPILVVVNLDQQLGYAYRNGVLIGWTTVSTGKKG